MGGEFRKRRAYQFRARLVILVEDVDDWHVNLCCGISANEVVVVEHLGVSYVNAA